MSTMTLKSPILTGVRADEGRFVDNCRVPENLEGVGVLLDGHNTLAATPFFADELVRILLVERHASRLTVSVAGDEFTRWIVESAERLGVADRVQAKG